MRATTVDSPEKRSYLTRRARRSKGDHHLCRAVLTPVNPTPPPTTVRVEKKVSNPSADLNKLDPCLKQQGTPPTNWIFPACPLMPSHQAHRPLPYFKKLISYNKPPPSAGHSLSSLLLSFSHTLLTSQSPHISFIMVQSSILGFPRMGVNRDLKKATEACKSPEIESYIAGAPSRFGFNG
jgi:hypothetical protein